MDFGIAFDGDGDRIGVIDDKGRVLSGDQLLLLFAKEILKKKRGAKIIGDVKCSQVVFDEIKRNMGKAIISKTGHSHVKINIKKYNADLAGEMSGHIFFNLDYYGLMMHTHQLNLLSYLTTAKKSYLKLSTTYQSLLILLKLELNVVI